MHFDERRRSAPLFQLRTFRACDFLFHLDAHRPSVAKLRRLDTRENGGTRDATSRGMIRLRTVLVALPMGALHLLGACSDDERPPVTDSFANGPVGAAGSGGGGNGSSGSSGGNSAADAAATPADDDGGTTSPDLDGAAPGSSLDGAVPGDDGSTTPLDSGLEEPNLPDAF